MQVPDLLVGERGGRLVEHEQAGVGGEPSGDHDHATVGDRERAELAIRIDARSQPLEHGGRLPAQGTPLHERAGDLRIPEPELDVLGHRQVRDVGELLVHECEAAPRRVEWAVEADGLAVDDELALVGLHHAREDLDQRALPGPVLPEQPDDRAGDDDAGGMIERDHAGIALHEALDHDERLAPGADRVGGMGAECRRRLGAFAAKASGRPSSRVSARSPSPRPRSC